MVTEEQTIGAKESAKSIDIVLEGDDWVIGIENKIHHHANNPFDDYWCHLKSKNKRPLGILLTLFPSKIEEAKFKYGKYFLNVTHQELLECIQQNLQLTGEFSSTDLFYLREYFKNIESHYYHLKETPEMDKIVEQIVKNYVAISEIVEKKEASEKHIEKTIEDTFAEYEYEKAGKWFRRVDKKYNLYFYLPSASELMKTNSLWLCFEIRNQTNQTVDKGAFIQHFRDEFAQLQNFKQNILVSTKQRTHAFIYQEDNFFQKELSFKSKFEEVLERLINMSDAPVLKVEKYLAERNHFKTN